MDCIVHGVAKSRTQLSDFYFTSLSVVITVTLPVRMQISSKCGIR